MGQQKDDGAAWSQLLNKANGRLQYDLEIIVKSNGDSDFPLFGTKHAGIDDITYTGQNVKDEESLPIKQFKDRQKWQILPMLKSINEPSSFFWRKK